LRFIKKIGMMGGIQIMSLSVDGCVFDSIAAHEAIHALGLSLN
jgi:hypothetical protein